MRKHCILLIAILTLGISFINAHAEDNKLEITLEKNNVSLGNPVYLYVTFTGAQNVDQPDIPEIDGLKITYVGPATKMSIVNGQVSQSITHTFLIIGRKEGGFDIGPLSVDYKGNRYTSNKITLMIRGKPVQKAPSYTPPGGTSPQGLPQEEKTESYRGDNIFLEMSVLKRSVYVNETLPVSIMLYVGPVRVKNIEFPSYSHEGFSTGDFEEPERTGRVVNGIRYDVLSFKQDLFPIKEGEYNLGPAHLNCKILQKQDYGRSRSRFSFDDFFSSSFGYTAYPIEVESGSIPITILPFPEQGKPADFQGAVGEFNMSAYIKPPVVKEGDPVVVTMIISGEGNFDTVTSPVIDVTDDFKTYEPEVKREKNKKIYEQILIPKDHNIKEIPEISFSFLNPSTGRYETIKKGPFGISVNKRPDSEQGVKVVSASGTDKGFYSREELGKDIIYIKENIGQLKRTGRELYGNKLFLSGQILPIVIFGIFYSVYKRKERMLTDKKYARFMKAPKAARSGMKKAKAHLDKGEVTLFYDAIFKTIQGYLSHKFNIAIGNITPQSAEDKLKKAGCSEEIVSILHEVFSACEMARYASSEEGNQPHEIFSMVKKVIDTIEKTKL